MQSISNDVATFASLIFINFSIDQKLQCRKWSGIYSVFGSKVVECCTCICTGMPFIPKKKCCTIFILNKLWRQKLKAQIKQNRAKKLNDGNSSHSFHRFNELHSNVFYITALNAECILIINKPATQRPHTHCDVHENRSKNYFEQITLQIAITCVRVCAACAAW